MADQLGRSVGDMYKGAFIPGLVLAGLYARYVFVVAILFPKAAPGLPVEAVGFEARTARAASGCSASRAFGSSPHVMTLRRARVRRLRRAHHVVGVGVVSLRVFNRISGRGSLTAVTLAASCLVLAGHARDGAAVGGLASRAYALARIERPQLGARVGMAEQVIFVMVPPLA